MGRSRAMLPELDAAKAAEGKQVTWLSDAWAGKGNGVMGPNDVDSSLRCEKSGICEGIASCKAGMFPCFSRGWPATVDLLLLWLTGPAVKHDSQSSGETRLPSRIIASTRGSANPRCMLAAQGHSSNPQQPDSTPASHPVSSCRACRQAGLHHEQCKAAGGCPGGCQVELGSIQVSAP